MYFAHAGHHHVVEETATVPKNMGSVVLITAGILAVVALVILLIVSKHRKK